MLDEILDDAKNRMENSAQSLRNEFSKLRTGRASTSLVEDIRADYYGTQTPLNQMSSISVPEPRTIIIQPWDTNAIREIEKAIQKSDLGINPTNDGKIIRLVIPNLTEERRKELVKHVGKITEDHRITIRQIRKDSNNYMKEVEKEEHISEDKVKSALTKIQSLTDDYIKKINEILGEKEKEIMEI
ncbi:MAG: ribosome recycling factor [Candidatus Dadabacteria bacterium]|nr:ribosome recycling factor [Candidatus Dadabacteria bacterium]